MRILISFIFSFLFQHAMAQNGTIAGFVKDQKTSEGLIGANVLIKGTGVGAATDINGNFAINNLKPGTYSLVVSSVTYKTQTIDEVVVESGKKTTLEIRLLEDIGELQEVVVQATRDISTDFTVLSAIKDSKLVVSGISSEQIARLPDRDAAQVMQRVPGVTIVDNRFVIIRGVPERYNQVMVNGAIAPSTEIDRRSFSFDLIPAGTVDQMLIYKSGAAELPGDFAGGVIQMMTKKPAHEDFTSFSVGFGYRTNTTFQDYTSSKGSSTDVIGYDNGFRDLPSDFPTTSVLQAANRTSGTRERAGKSLTNNFGNTTRTTPLDMAYNLTTSNSFKFGSVRASNLTSIAYSNSYQNYQSNFLRYNSFTATTAEKRFEYLDHVYSNDVRINLMHNWLVNVNDRHKFEFKNLFVQLGEHETTVRKGEDFIQRPNDDLVNYAYHYLSRTIYTGQLEGFHTLGDGSSSINWTLGLNYVNRNEPDYRRFRTFRDKALAGTEEPFSMQLPPSGNLFETGRFYSTLRDIGYSNGLNFEKKFGDKTDKRTPTFKAGYYVEYKTREFNARYINYLYPGTNDQLIGEALRKLPLDQVFAPENIKKQDGFVIEEGTQPQDAYQGKNLLTAGYLSGAMPFGKFDVSAGMRAEYNVQKLSAITNTGIVDVNNPIFAPLPFLNIAYNASDRSLLRMAYSRTLNRPEFRELAPFLYYQFEYEAGIFGNAALKTAFINNIDLRWEMYPNPGETLSIGGFFKDFSNPIETYLQITSETPQLYFGNAQSAKTYGIEVELRKSLASLGVSKFLRNLSVNINTALIKSEVNVGTAATNQSQFRPLQGQSPYIINTGVYYHDEETGLSINAAYNVFGPRIFSVGDKLFPSWWELPRQSLDLQVAKKWGKKRFETKLNAQNVLNSAYRIYQDSDNNNSIETSEALIQQYKVGTQFSFSMSWKISKGS